MSDKILIPFMEILYPVGSVYETTDGDFNPNTKWGGTWEKLTDKFLVGAGNTYANGSTGGKTAHSHTLNGTGFAQITAHFATDAIYSNEATNTPGYSSQLDGADSGRAIVTHDSFSGGTGTSTNLSGSTGTESNLPPYLAVFMWHRTA